MIWFLDMFIDPTFAKTRMTINGIEIPIFNRFALAAMMMNGQPETNPETASTPHILVTRALLRAPGGYLSFQSGTDYYDKTGADREFGHILDLLSGFTMTTWRLLNQKSRQEWMQAVLQAATPIKRNIVPAGWVDLESGMQDFSTTVKQMLTWSGTVNSDSNNCLIEGSSPSYHAHFGLGAIPHAKELMVPKALIPVLARQYTKRPAMRAKTPSFGKSSAHLSSVEFRNLGLVAAKLVAVGLLVGTLWQQPYDYYTPLRVVVCSVSACAAFRSSKRGNHRWKWCLAVVAFAFNPIIPLHLTRGGWMVVDFATAAPLLTSIYALDRRYYR